MGQYLTKVIEIMGQYLPKLTTSPSLPPPPPQSPPPLLQLSMDGDIEKIKKYIEEQDCKKSSSLSSVVNQSDTEGNTALIGAAFLGHANVCTFLVEECKADLGLKNGIGCTALWIAAGYGRIDVLSFLIRRIRKGIIGRLTDGDDDDVDDNDNGDNGDDEDRHQYGRDEAMALLCGPNGTGDTPLIAAASRGHEECCRILLRGVEQLDANPTAGDDSNDDDDDKRKRNDDTKNVNSTTCFDLVCVTNDAGDTALSVAVGGGHGVGLLSLLLDYEKANLSPDTANRPLFSTNSKGLTPLLVACERNDESAVKELLSKGADRMGTDENDRSPLAVASFCGCKDVVKYLLSIEGVDVGDVGKKKIIDAMDNQECTPLWLAARTGNVALVDMLVAAGADVELRGGSEKMTPEEVAIKYKKQPVVDFFRASRILK